MPAPSNTTEQAQDTTGTGGPAAALVDYARRIATEYHARHGCPITRDALRARRQAYEEARNAAGEAWCDDIGLVFTTASGRPVEPSNFRRSFATACAKAGVRKIHVHATRKTCASLLVALDVHPRAAMQTLRHSQIVVTMNIYSEVSSEVTRKPTNASATNSPHKPQSTLVGRRSDMVATSHRGGHHAYAVAHAGGAPVSQRLIAAWGWLTVSVRCVILSSAF